MEPIGYLIDGELLCLLHGREERAEAQRIHLEQVGEPIEDWELDDKVTPVYDGYEPTKQPCARQGCLNTIMYPKYHAQP